MLRICSYYDHQGLIQVQAYVPTLNTLGVSSFSNILQRMNTSDRHGIIFTGWQVGSLTLSLGNYINQSDQVQEIPGDNKLEIERSAPQTSILETQVLWGNRLIVLRNGPAQILGRTDLHYSLSIQLTIPFLLLCCLQLRLRNVLLWFYLAEFPCWSQFPEGGIKGCSLRQTSRVVSEEPRTPSTRT